MDRVPVWLAGLALLARGAALHSSRLIVVGGIITGAGLAVASQSGPWIAGQDEPRRKGLFFFCLALGWFLVILVTRLAAPRTLWWPLLPGTVLAITGAAAWLFHSQSSSIFPLLWPLPLVAAGLFLIILWNRSK